jgi:hypothetical protein
LNDNGFTGGISSAISGFTNLVILNISGNAGLSGTIPLDITSISPYRFDFRATGLCEPDDLTYDGWAMTVTQYFPGACDATDLTIESISFSPTNPGPGEAFTVNVLVTNVGAVTAPTFVVDLYYDRTPTGCGDTGEIAKAISSLAVGESVLVDIPISGFTEGSYEIDAYVDINCVVIEGDESNNGFGPVPLKIIDFLFESYFETNDLSEWTRVNTGGGFLYTCTQAAINGTYGACVERGTNNKRKQLIDDTPANETNFATRFNFDINSLSMGAGERFRFMQVKMGAERPFFIVLKYQGGQYYIQLNTKLDDLTKVKSGWHLLSDAVHTIEVNWQASSAPGANDGYVDLYIDDVLQETLGNLDNDTLYIDSFRMGFTSKLAGKIISGIFYIDDVGTDDAGHIGLP